MEGGEEESGGEGDDKGGGREEGGEGQRLGKFNEWEDFTVQLLQNVLGAELFGLFRNKSKLC